MTTPTKLETAKQELLPSNVRTLFPFIMGAVVSKITDYGIDLSANEQAFLTLVFGWIWYAIPRALEVFGSDKWGYVLGYKKKPVYVEPPATVIDAEGTHVVQEDGPVVEGEVADEEEITNPLHVEDDDPESLIGEDVESFFEAHAPEAGK